jgi:hypothetical protein
MESDHVLTHVYNLFTGGTCIEDIANLQCSEPVRRILGASRLPDPTTAGDFLRRFRADSLDALNGCIDEAQSKLWRRAHRGKRRLAVVDLDSHVKTIYGNQKEGADFTYQGSFGYHPLAITLANSQECLRLINRPGNLTSADGAAEALTEVFPLLQSHFKEIIVRGDSAFAQQSLYDACEEHNQFFAFVSPAHPNFEALADALPEKAWKPFRASPPKAAKVSQRRKRGQNLRRRRARARGKRDLKLKKQWIAEIEYRPARSERSYRLILRRQRIEEFKQGELFELWRYRYAISNLPKKTHSCEEVLRLTYQRCDQENVIEQLQNGVAAMRMPTGSFMANSAYLLCARLAHNLKSWLAQVALPVEVMRWKWKRFRYAFVYIAVRVIHHARQTTLYVADSHRFAEMLQTGIVRLNT